MITEKSENCNNSEKTLSVENSENTINNEQKTEIKTLANKFYKDNSEIEKFLINHKENI